MGSPCPKSFPIRSLRIQMSGYHLGGEGGEDKQGELSQRRKKRYVTVAHWPTGPSPTPEPYTLIRFRSCFPKKKDRLRR